MPYQPTTDRNTCPGCGWRRPDPVTRPSGRAPLNALERVPDRSVHCRVCCTTRPTVASHKAHLSAPDTSECTGGGAE